MRLGPPILATALAVAGVMQQAAAMNYRRLTTEDGQTLIEAAGPIGFGDGARFQNFLDWLPAGTRPVAVSVDSPGGSVVEAADIAQAIQARGLPVAVIGSHTCASACFLLFAAAPSRMVGPNALVGVHSASEGGQETINSMAFTTVMAREAKALHVPPAIIGKMVTTSAEDMSWLSVPDLRGMDVTLVDEEQSRRMLAGSVMGSPQLSSSTGKLMEPSSPPIASSRRPSLDQRAIEFARQTFVIWSSDDATANTFVSHAYAPIVDFYGKPTRSQEIVSAKQAYMLRWPTRDYRLREGSTQTACDAGNAICTVSGIVDWSCGSPQRNAQSAGAATFLIRVNLSLSAGMIVAESGSVIGRGVSSR